jgi:hypothetical protein
VQNPVQYLAILERALYVDSRFELVVDVANPALPNLSLAGGGSGLRLHFGGCGFGMGNVHENWIA